MAARNWYPKHCAECGALVAEKQGFLFGRNNDVVHEDCVVWSYGVAKGYFPDGPRPVRSVPIYQDGQQ